MPRRVLLMLPQLPQDPASGAAHSARTIAEFLAEAGFEVRALAVTATERGLQEDPVEYLRRSGLNVEVDRRGGVGSARRVLRLEHKGVPYELLDTGDLPFLRWGRTLGGQFDALLAKALRWKPDVVFTYGGSPEDLRRRKMVRDSGSALVFCLFNMSYLHPGAFEHVDAVCACSRFLTERYREKIGLVSTPIWNPLHLDEVVAETHERVFVTYVNPSPEKGVMFAARLFEELGTRRPDLPALVIEARGTAGTLTAAGIAGGFDLRRHESLMISGSVMRPRDIFEPARVLLAPSAWEEAAGRVAAEALVNGIPPIVSDRGGLPEMCGDAGFVLPLPEGMSPTSRRPPGPDAVRPWLEVIERLYDDEAFYAEASQKALEAGHRHRPEALRPQYVAFFERVRAGSPSVIRPRGASGEAPTD